MDVVAILIFITGAIVGSFLNVCIVRLPQEKSLAFPGSHCVHCKKAIPWHENIPLLSWVLLRGQCANCGGKISSRYFLVELLTAVVFVLFYLHYGLSAVLAPYLWMVCCFIVATFVDFACRIIPDEVSVGGMFAGVLFSAAIPALHPISAEQAAFGGFMAGLLVLLCALLTLIYPIFCKHLIDERAPSDRDVKILVAGTLFLIVLIDRFAGAMPQGLLPHALGLSAALSGYLVGGSMIYAMGLFGDIVFKKESMGGGDVKLVAMVGAFLGWQLACLTFFLAPFFGAVYGIIEKIRTKDSTMPYGPFLVLGALVSLFYGQQIILWLLRGGMYGA
jgi:leader peptidase (prepilin peptidase) / N-methyltransferase